jgi:hypothetical protein
MPHTDLRLFNATAAAHPTDREPSHKAWRELEAAVIRRSPWLALRAGARIGWYLLTGK